MRRILFLVFAFIFLSAPVAAWACPFCSAPSLTLSEQLDQSEVVALVTWIGGTEPDRDLGTAGTTKYRIKDMMRGESAEMKKGEIVEVERYRPAAEGDEFLLMGNIADGVEWSSPLEVTPSSYEYLANLPSSEQPQEQRLAFFMNYLEHPDTLVANDAYAEFANAPYEQITPLASAMPRENVRKWVAAPDTAPTRLGLYGLMLGLCGTTEDVPLMEEIIFKKTDDFRLGIDGVMGGYLLLTGEEGLAKLEDKKLEDKSVPFSETYAAMQALRFLWTYGDGVVSQDRLRASMRILLDRPELADLVIQDLARWNDWSIMDQLMALYDDESYSVPSIKRAIVRFMLAASKNNEGDTPEDVVAAAKANLETLEEKDPKTVKAAERFFFLN